MKVKLANKRWRTYASIDPKKNYDRVNCYSCDYCGDDGSCACKGVYIPEVGADIWKICRDFMLDTEYDNAKNRDRVKRYWKCGEKKKPEYLDSNREATYEGIEEEIEVESIAVGSIVRVFNYRMQEKEEYEIVESGQGDPTELKLSNDSLFVKAMLGKNIGDNFNVICEDGSYACKLLELK